MKHYKSNAELKNLAKEKLSGQFSNAVFALLLVSMLTRAVSNLALSLIPSGGIVWDIVAILFTSVIAVFLGILQTGIAYYFLNSACGIHPHYSNLFYGFRECRDKSVKISFVHVLAETICLMPFQVLFLLFTRTMNTSHLTAAGIALVIGYIILIPINMAISQTYYLLLDFPEDSAKDIIKSSIRIMKGHKKRLFFLEVSFLPLYLLCLLSLGIGLLWLEPYMRMTYTLFFLDLMKPE